MENFEPKSDITVEVTEFQPPSLSLESTVYQSKNWMEVVTTTNKHSNNISRYRKIGSNCFLDCSTGEVREYNSYQNTSADYSKFKRNYDELRRILSANITGNGSEYHVVLTVRPELNTSLTDVYKYFTAFRKRIQYYYSDIEYIAIAEPHENGKYHLHVVLLLSATQHDAFNDKTIAHLWEVGFSKVGGIKNADKIINYLCSSKKRERWAKFYKPHRRLFRCSKGVIRPQPTHMTREEVNNYAKAESLYPTAASRYVVKRVLEKGESQILNIVTREQFRRR